MTDLYQFNGIYQADWEFNITNVNEEGILKGLLMKITFNFKAEIEPNVRHLPVSECTYCSTIRQIVDILPLSLHTGRQFYRNQLRLPKIAERVQCSAVPKSDRNPISEAKHNGHDKI